MITKKQRKKIVRNVIRFVKFRILHIDDSPHRIALGLALGLFTAYMPPLGFHIFVVLALCFILRANKFVGLTFIWVSNPFTYIPLYYPNYLVGKFILARFQTAPRMALADIDKIFTDTLSLQHIITNFYTSQFWHQIADLLIQIGAEMFLGGLVLGAIAASAAYMATFKLIVWYRRKHPHHFPEYV